MCIKIMKKTIKLNISDFSVPPPFRESYIQEICEREKVKVVDSYEYEEKFDFFPYYFKGIIVLLEGEI